MMDDFKKANTTSYTAKDLNCRNVVPHTRQHNKLEKLMRRMARKKLKKSLKKLLTDST